MPQSEAQMVQWIETTAALWTEHFNCLLIHKIPVLQTWVYYYIDKENTTDNTQNTSKKTKPLQDENNNKTKDLFDRINVMKKNELKRRENTTYVY